ncbi:hypothetical protein HY844_02800 [Candidatus Berkelbacteria bacterium]|nr:hypothetical protein [Candidatus Berkelbacteria bacterium]
MKQKQRASSLILVLLVVAGIITVIFGTQRIVLVQYNQANSEEDNLYAYYAAKAGIEDGLLRYRTSKNVEIPKGSEFKYDLRAGTDGTNFKQKANQQSYDLGIEYKTNKIETRELIRNSTITLSGFTQVADSVYLNLFFKRTDTTCVDDGVAVGSGKDSSFVQIQILDSTNNIQNIVANFNNTGTWSTDSTTPILINSASNVLQVRFTPYYCDITFEASVSGSTNPPIEFDSLNTTITATGYYGNAKRTLVALVDRTSDKLIGIYEFNAYSGTGNIKP